MENGKATSDVYILFFHFKSIYYLCTCSCRRNIKINYSCAPNVLGSWLAMWGVNPGRVWLAMQFWGDGCCSKVGEAWYHYKSEFTFPPFLYHLPKAIGTFSYKYGAQNHDFFRDTFTDSKVCIYWPSWCYLLVLCLFFSPQHWSMFCIQDSIGRICCVPLKRANEIIGATTEELVMKARQS
jgi:hypothetical protein